MADSVSTPDAAQGLRRYDTVQALRALAALMVASGHVLHDAQSLGAQSLGAQSLGAQSLGAPHWLTRASTLMPWGAGVDIFFVISGFVIAHASAPLFGGGWPAARTFLARRLTRVVPLYWAASLLFLGAEAADPGAIHGALGGVAWGLASFLFIPWPRPDGSVLPVLGLGWTLNYEMLFYAVLALCIPFRRALLYAVGALAALILAGRWLPLPGPLGFWSNPIVAEFMAGVGLAVAARRGVALSQDGRLALAILGLLLLQAKLVDLPRPIGFGIPSAMLVAAAVLWPQRYPVRAAPWLILLGDASYALYLTHPFPMRALSIAAFHLHTGPAAYVVATMAAVLATGLAAHVWIERPMLRWVRGKVRPGALPLDPARGYTP